MHKKHEKLDMGQYQLYFFCGQPIMKIPPSKVQSVHIIYVSNGDLQYVPVLYNYVTICDA